MDNDMRQQLQNYIAVIHEADWYAQLTKGKPIGNVAGKYAARLLKQFMVAVQAVCEVDNTPVTDLWLLGAMQGEYGLLANGEPDVSVIGWSTGNWSRAGVAVSLRSLDWEHGLELYLNQQPTGLWFKTQQEVIDLLCGLRLGPWRLRHAMHEIARKADDE
jgi:hypothetical protein